MDMANDGLLLPAGTAHQEAQTGGRIIIVYLSTFD
jgi:hypothetical protein